MTAATVADPAIRHRGTFGGSLAHADPAGDMPTAALALDCTMLVAGPAGRREVAAADFFVDYFTSALYWDEVLVAVRVPKLGAGLGLRLPEVPPHGAVVGDRRGGRGGAAGERVHRRGQGGADQHGRRPASGRPRWRRRWGCGRLRRGRWRGARRLPPTAPIPTSELHAQADYREHLARVLSRGRWSPPPALRLPRRRSRPCGPAVAAAGLEPSTSPTRSLAGRFWPAWTLRRSVAHAPAVSLTPDTAHPADVLPFAQSRPTWFRAPPTDPTPVVAPATGPTPQRTWNRFAVRADAASGARLRSSWPARRG